MKQRLISFLTVLLMLSFAVVCADAAPVCWFVNGSCYEKIEVEGTGINWEDAKTAAESLSFQGVYGHLATITSQEENNFVVNNLGGPNAVQYHWLGGFQPPGSLEPADGWQWVTGEPFIFTNWAPFEPNDAGGYEDAIGFFGSDLWNDNLKAIELHGYIVEYPEASFSAQELFERIETLESQVEFLIQQIDDGPEDCSNSERKASDSLRKIVLKICKQYPSLRLCRVLHR